MNHPLRIIEFSDYRKPEVVKQILSKWVSVATSVEKKKVHLDFLKIASRNKTVLQYTILSVVVYVDRSSPYVFCLCYEPKECTSTYYSYK